MTYTDQLTAALAELDKIAERQARMQVLRDISNRQQLDTIAIALNTNILEPIEELAVVLSAEQFIRIR